MASRTEPMAGGAVAQRSDAMAGTDGLPPKAIQPRKASRADQCARLEQIPNIGVSLAQDLRELGIEQPTQLIGRDPLELYRALCQLSGQRQDPCVLDTFMAAVDFMQGRQALPWWHYTPERKRLHPGI